LSRFTICRFLGGCIQILNTALILSYAIAIVWVALLGYGINAYSRVSKAPFDYIMGCFIWVTASLFISSTDYYVQTLKSEVIITRNFDNTEVYVITTDKRLVTFDKAIDVKSINDSTEFKTKTYYDAWKNVNRKHLFYIKGSRNGKHNNK
jgi:hypothetical protein